MKKLAVVFVLAFTIISCKKDAKKDVKQKEVVEVKESKFPSELHKVFQFHGGISNWQSNQLLSFNIKEETHTVALQSRKTVINAPKYSLGFDGNQVWLDEENDGDYKGNPKFYYNLYFYFYAMPFVLGDNGIVYGKAEDLVFENVKYPGFKISYKANIGNSANDNYIVYYNPETYKMEWLAYTVTFNSKTSSNRYNLIKYKKWEHVNGFLLPNEIIWYAQDKNGLPTKPVGNSVKFTLPLISKTKMANSFFEKPKG